MLSISRREFLTTLTALNALAFAPLTRLHAADDDRIHLIAHRGGIVASLRQHRLRFAF